MLEIGLVGYGNFGKLIEKHLHSMTQFKIYDLNDQHDTAEEVLNQPIIILAIPAQFIKSFLRDNTQWLNPHALYIDVASVKVKPVQAMLATLPSSADIIATHPLFGPATASDSLKDRKIMTHPVRVSEERYREFRKFLSGLGLQIIDSTPEEHDRAMAYVQGLSHYIGRIMQQMNIPATQFATRAYEDLCDMKNIQGNDSDALFHSILHENSFTPAVLSEFEQARRTVDETFGIEPISLVGL